MILEDWRALANCGDCNLDATLYVPTICPQKNPRLMFIGEAPGAEEVSQGKPFVGRAGKVIRAINKELGIDSDNICWANTCACRPPKNRTPTAAEMRCCLPRLRSEIRDINPTMIVCLGVTPSRALVPGFKSIAKSRGTVYTTEDGFQVICTYHPAAALYSGGDKIIPFIAADLKTAVDHLEGVEREYSDPETKVFIADTDEKIDALKAALFDLTDKDFLVVDWETTGLRNNRDVGWCMGMSWQVGTGVSVPTPMIRKHIDFFREYFNKNRPNIPKIVGYNSMFDLGFSRALGIDMKFDHDAMLLHYCLDERQQQRSLENLTVDRFNAPRYESELTSKFDTSKGDMWKNAPIEDIMVYCAKDCDWTLRLFLDLSEEASKTPEVWEPYKTLLIPAIPVFRDIEDYGLWVDTERHAELTKRFEVRIQLLENELKEATSNPDFNPRSHQQVQEVLWDDLLLEQPRMKKRKDRSADKATRDALLKKYPNEKIVQTLNEYSKTHTYYSRYLQSLPTYLDVGDNRIRPNYHFDRTATGRLSATKPGVHQIPRDSEIRGMYAAPQGRVLVQADYSQLELRMAAHIAKDTNMTAIVNNTEVDFHKQMASMAFKVPVEEVTPEQRQKSKPFTFGVLYFMSPVTLAQQSGLSIKEASRVADNYWDMMPDIKKWTEDIRKQILANRYVESIFGRRKRFPLITQENFDALHREAVNMPIQSSASDLTLYNVIRLNKRLKQFYPEAHIVVTVHDSIVVECPAPVAEEVATLVKKTMTEDLPFETEVKFPVEIKIGQRWGEGAVWTEEKAEAAQGS